MDGAFVGDALFDRFDFTAVAVRRLFQRPFVEGVRASPSCLYAC